MTFSDLGFFYLEPGQDVDVEFWWGDGDDHGAIFAMALFKGITTGLIYLGPNDPFDPPSYEFETSAFRRETHYTFYERAEDTIQGSYPAHFYYVNVKNTGHDAAYFRLDGMTSI